MFPKPVSRQWQQHLPPGPRPATALRTAPRWITRRMQLLNITDIKRDRAQSGIHDSIVRSRSHHHHAVFLNSGRTLLVDVKRYLDEAVQRDSYRHNDPKHSDCERSNADSHLRGMLMDKLSAAVRNKVLLGTWQRIILAEFDGPRRSVICGYRYLA